MSAILSIAIIGLFAIISIAIIGLFAAWCYGCIHDASKLWALGKAKYALPCALCGIAPLVLVVLVINNIWSVK